MRRAEKIPQLVKKLGTGGEIYGLLKALGLALPLILAAVGAHISGAPLYISLFFIFIALMALFVSIIRLKRVSSVRFESTDLDEGFPDTDFSYMGPVPEAGEIILTSVPAVMEYGKIRSRSVFGAGKVFTPENALIISNKTIWAMTVPLPGADMVVADTDIGKWQWMFAYQDIVDELEKMLVEMSLQDLLKKGKAKKLMNLDELKSAEDVPLSQAISLTRSDDKKFAYSIRKKEDYLRAKEALKID